MLCIIPYDIVWYYHVQPSDIHYVHIYSATNVSSSSIPTTTDTCTRIPYTTLKTDRLRYVCHVYEPTVRYTHIIRTSPGQVGKSAVLTYIVLQVNNGKYIKSACVGTSSSPCKLFHVYHGRY